MTKYSGGVEIATGFKNLTNEPVSDDMVFDLVTDLEASKYNGHIAFVEETQQLYVKTDTGWKVIESEIVADSILKYGTVKIEGNLATIAANSFQWRINQIRFTETPAFSQAITLATDNFYRNDIICGTSAGTILLIQGIENESAITDPAVPDGMIKLATIPVFGSVIGTPVSDVKGFKEKAEDDYNYEVTTADQDILDLTEKSSYMIFGAMTVLRRLMDSETDSPSYSGRVLTFMNKSGHDITFESALSSPTIVDNTRYLLLPDGDLVLKNNQIVTLKQDPHSYNYYRLVSTSIYKPSLQEVCEVSEGITSTGLFVAGASYGSRFIAFDTAEEKESQPIGGQFGVFKQNNGSYAAYVSVSGTAGITNNISYGARALSNLQKINAAKCNYNTAIGSDALEVLNDPVGTGENTALGKSTLRKLVTGIRNIAIGYSAGNRIVNGSNNIFIGAHAGGSIGNIKLSDNGSGNTLIGSSFELRTGLSNNTTFIGDGKGIVFESYANGETNVPKQTLEAYDSGSVKGIVTKEILADKLTKAQAGSQIKVIKLSENTTLSAIHNNAILLIVGDVRLTIPKNLAALFVSCVIDVKSGFCSVTQSTDVVITGHYTLNLLPTDRSSLYKEDIPEDNYRLI